MGDYIVYKHTAPSGKSYIGISKDPVKRWNDGKGYIKNIRFWRAIQKYGWENIKHEYLYEGMSASKAKQIERELIEQNDLTNPNNGYNIREGGDGSFSESSLQLMSKSRIGNKNSVGRKLSGKTKGQISDSLQKYYRNHESPFKGKRHSKETKQILRDKNVSNETRKKMSEHHADFTGANNPSAKAVVAIDENGNILEEFGCAKQAAAKYGIDLSSLIKCCRGKHKTAGGKVWRYKSEMLCSSLSGQILH